MRGIHTPARRLAGSTALFYIIGSLTVNVSQQTVHIEALPYESPEAAATHGLTNGTWQPVVGADKTVEFVPPSSGRSLSFRNPGAKALRVTKSWKFSAFSPAFDIDGDIHGQALAQLLRESEWGSAKLGDTTPISAPVA
jgi:hypothetical protein